MHIRFEKGINKDNSIRLCQWSNNLGKGFQEQWMGPQISYPLSPAKISKLKNLFSIFCEDAFIGAIQKVRIDEDNIHIGRFLIDPNRAGMGLGTEALKTFVEFIFEDDHIRSVTLTVFDYNQSAKRLYEKLGFEIDKIVASPELKYIMRKNKIH